MSGFRSVIPAAAPIPGAYVPEVLLIDNFTEDFTFGFNIFMPLPFFVIVSGSAIATNAGATGMITGFLAELPNDGQVWSVYIRDPQLIRIQTTNAADTIILGNVESAPGGYVESDVVGSTIELVGIGQKWVARSFTGSWNVV